MPYVTERQKAQLKPLTDALVVFMGQNREMKAGDLNYIITTVVNQWLAQKSKVGYEEMNAAMGALVGAQAEFYRRMVAPYEDQKMEENGDVYPKQEAEAKAEMVPIVVPPTKTILVPKAAGLCNICGGHHTTDRHSFRDVPANI